MRGIEQAILNNHKRSQRTIQDKGNRILRESKKLGNGKFKISINGRRNGTQK